MSTFITLPSGLRLNRDNIVQYCPYHNDPTKTYMEISSSVDGSNERTEDMTATELDALLSPSSSPIVSPVLELRLPRPGEAVCFKWEGKLRHGIVQSPQVEDDKIIIVSDGDEYQYDLPSSYTVKLQ